MLMTVRMQLPLTVLSNYDMISSPGAQRKGRGGGIILAIMNIYAKAVERILNLKNCLDL